MKPSLHLLAQADLLLLVADLLRPPEKLQQPLGNLSNETLTDLMAATGLQPVAELDDQLQCAIRAARDAVPHEWAGCYRRLFDGFIACPVNEAGYVRRDKGAIIGDVCGFYNAFGWEPVQNSGERPDHLLVELEFAAMLLVMAARADNPSDTAITRSALAEFTRQHLSDWLPDFCSELRNSTSYPVFVQTASFLESLWPALVAWHQWVVDPPTQGQPPLDQEPESPYECGAPEFVSLQTN